MDRISKAQLDQEPIGIIISGGYQVEEQPRFSAYVWGPVPDEPEQQQLTASGSHKAA